MNGGLGFCIYIEDTLRHVSSSAQRTQLASALRLLSQHRNHTIIIGASDAQAILGALPKQVSLVQYIYTMQHPRLGGTEGPF